MTEIYQVPPDASLEAVRRTVGQWRNKRIALEVPEGWLELNNVARMRLLQRQAQIQHNEVAIITREAATRSAARQVGIPVFGRVEDAAGDRWHMDPMLPLVDPRAPEAALPEPPLHQPGMGARLHHVDDGRLDAVNLMQQPPHHRRYGQRQLAPGLGVDVDEEALKQHPAKVYPARKLRHPADEGP